MKKQILFTSLILVLALCLAGTVSAEDVDNDTSLGNDLPLEETNKEQFDDTPSDVTISGEVLKCSDGRPFSGVKLTVNDANEQLITTTTNNAGYYLLKFTSSNNNFTVTASYPGHKPSSELVTVTKEINNKSYATANFTLGVFDTYVYNGWATNPEEEITFPDGTTINKSAENAYLTIQEGIDNVLENYTVYVANGTYKEHILIEKSLNLSGQSPARTIIEGIDNNKPVITINNGIIAINNFTIQKGNMTGTDNFGAGIRKFNGALTLNNCIVQNNNITSESTLTDATSIGGGIYNNNGALTIVNSIIQDNKITATTDNDFLTAIAYGGGIYNNNGELTIVNSFIQNNIIRSNSPNYNAYARGGGIYNYNGDLNINDSIIQNNIITTTKGTGDWA